MQAQTGKMNKESGLKMCEPWWFGIVFFIDLFMLKNST